jgi:hypothetical protein
MQKIDGAALNDSSYKLYVSGSSKDRNQMEAVRALMQMALRFIHFFNCHLVVLCLKHIMVRMLTRI